MIERVLDAVTQSVSNGGNQLRPKFTSNRISAQRKRQSSKFVPPLAHVQDLVQAGVLIGELAFMDNQPSFKLAGHNVGNDLVERDDRGFTLGANQFPPQVTPAHRPGPAPLPPFPL